MAAAAAAAGGAACASGGFKRRMMFFAVDVRRPAGSAADDFAAVISHVGSTLREYGNCVAQRGDTRQVLSVSVITGDEQCPVPLLKAQKFDLRAIHQCVAALLRRYTASASMCAGMTHAHAPGTTKPAEASDNAVPALRVLAGKVLSFRKNQPVRANVEVAVRYLSCRCLPADDVTDALVQEFNKSQAEFEFCYVALPRAAEEVSEQLAGLALIVSRWPKCHVTRIEHGFLPLQRTMRQWLIGDEQACCVLFPSDISAAADITAGAGIIRGLCALRAPRTTAECVTARAQRSDVVWCCFRSAVLPRMEVEPVTACACHGEAVDRGSQMGYPPRCPVTGAPLKVATTVPALQVGLSTFAATTAGAQQQREHWPLVGLGRVQLETLDQALLFGEAARVSALSDAADDVFYAICASLEAEDTGLLLVTRYSPDSSLPELPTLRYYVALPCSPTTLVLQEIAAYEQTLPPILAPVADHDVVVSPASHQAATSLLDRLETASYVPLQHRAGYHDAVAALVAAKPGQRHV
eukprot:TRINITY_DN2951_c0_g1_i2.p1 TRINITY_DN2951_c0_g1~~TRINITY_DN2951_c0_g1_i2.p1  ORF type:complete len:545 (-),score=120.27 TRINITY_DN2951_c0_g1_i2:36-1607(-)